MLNIPEDEEEDACPLVSPTSGREGVGRGAALCGAVFSAGRGCMKDIGFNGVDIAFLWPFAGGNEVSRRYGCGCEG